MLVQNQVGPQVTKKSLADTSVVVARAGQLGDIIVSELHGRYYETNYRNALFMGANTAGVTTTVGTAATYVGLCLSNPIGSPVNLSLTKVGWAAIVAFTAAASIGLMSGYSANVAVVHTTPITPRASLVGANAGYGLLDSSATLPVTPTLTHIIGAGLTGAITTLPSIGPVFIDMEGSIIIPPGGFVAFQTSTASGASGFFGSFQWEEVPI